MVHLPSVLYWMYMLPWQYGAPAICSVLDVHVTLTIWCTCHLFCTGCTCYPDNMVHLPSVLYWMYMLIIPWQYGAPAICSVLDVHVTLPWQYGAPAICSVLDVHVTLTIWCTCHLFCTGCTCYPDDMVHLPSVLYWMYMLPWQYGAPAICSVLDVHVNHTLTIWCTCHLFCTGCTCYPDNMVHLPSVLYWMYMLPWQYGAPAICSVLDVYVNHTLTI